MHSQSLFELRRQTQNLIMKNRLLITTAALLGFMANSISAAILVPNGNFSNGAAQALIVVSGTITVDADDGDSFKLGDTFDYSFTFNDEMTDTDLNTFSAQFNAGVSAFSLTRGGSNTGTWEPASGTFTVSPITNMNVNANGEFITLQVTGSGFPNLNGVAFFDVVLSYGFSGVYDFVDTGSGQTFAEVVGVSQLNFASASSQSAEIRNTSFNSPSLSTSVVAVPEPSIAVLVLMAGGAWLLRRRLRRSH